MFKVRNFVWIIGWLISVFCCDRTNSQNALISDTLDIKTDTGFSSVELAIDSLWWWSCNPKSAKSEQLMPERIFVQMAREKDTISPIIILHGQYINYRYRFTKGMESLHKSMRKKLIKSTSVEFKKSELIYYKNSGGAPSIRAEVPVIYRNKKYLFRTILLIYRNVYYPSGDIEIRYIGELPKKKKRKP